MDPGRLQRFVERQPRQNRRDALGHHRLARARRADHQYVVAAGGGGRQRPLGVLLPAHVREVRAVDGVVAEVIVQIHFDRLGVFAAGEDPDGVSQSLDSEHVDPFDHAGFPGVLGRNDQALDAGLRGGDGHRQDGAHRPRAAVQRQLAQDGHVVQAIPVDLLRSGQNAQRYWQIVGGAFFLEVGGGEVHHGAPVGKVKAGVFQRRAHAVAAFAHGRVRQADDQDPRHPGANVHFDLDQDRLDPKGTRTDCSRKHETRIR